MAWKPFLWFRFRLLHDLPARCGLHSRPFREVSVCFGFLCVQKYRRQVNIASALCDGFENLLLKMDDCKKPQVKKERKQPLYFQVFRRGQFLHFLTSGVELCVQFVFSWGGSFDRRGSLWNCNWHENRGLTFIAKHCVKWSIPLQEIVAF